MAGWISPHTGLLKKAPTIKKSRQDMVSSKKMFTHKKTKPSSMTEDLEAGGIGPSDEEFDDMMSEASKGPKGKTKKSMFRKKR